MITTTVKALVEHPDEVVVKPIEGEGTVVFEVQVHPEDAGKVIGKKGRTINALRTIIRASTGLGNKKVMMELV
ncbi:MAG: KH domain-containing protein [Candidatus Riflebacteria bacterium]|nr:KH domain-containing protein [Candidatus Riflebacteria bacterium]